MPKVYYPSSHNLVDTEEGDVPVFENLVRRAFVQLMPVKWRFLFSIEMFWWCVYPEVAHCELLEPVQKVRYAAPGFRHYSKELE